MRIGELVQKTGISRDTIRFYEKKGLITSSEGKDISNNYRDYDEENIKNISQIQFMKKLGFTLKECEVGIRKRKNNEFNPESNKKFIKERIALIDKQIQELVDIRTEFEVLYKEQGK
ncbi:MerR family transcriptional regulator [Candidatus Gracilibacteria bacterium 28_42_T64]|nr:MerR family transcriptional regulator [Candidatus Gracilibacteria bacterium 28_42_T64]